MRISPEDWHLIASRHGLSQADTELLTFFATSSEKLRTSEIKDHLGIRLSRPNVARRISRLVARGFLERTGSGPQTRYAINERQAVDAYLETDRALRSRKPFDIARIRDYDPGHSRLIPAEIAEELRHISDAAIKAGDTINQVVFRRYMVDFAWASSKMEGNTYSLLETQSLLENDTPAPDKSETEARMLRNHAAAIEYVIGNGRDLEITPHMIRGIHALLSKGLLPNPDDEGRIRRSPIAIGESIYRPETLPQVLEEGLRLISEKAEAIKDPYEASIFLLAQISYLQPFMDVNKRTARVAANIPLLRAVLCPLSYYGMDDRAYIRGLIAYYETNTASLLMDSYRQGYLAAAERYRTYSEYLSDVIGRDDGDRRRQSERLVMQYIRAVVSHETGPDERNQFLRNHIKTRDPGQRDTLLVSASKAISNLSEAGAIGMGIPVSLLRRYREVLAAHDQESSRPD